MGHRMAKLTALAISKLQKPGIHGDGAGLWLQVSKFGTRAWLFRFMQNGRARKMGLGPYPDVSLAEARQKAFGCRAQLRDDIDPIEARNARRAALRAETARQMTFRECAEKYIAAHAAGWKSAMHLAQWFSSLENFVYPLLGGLSVDKIETAHVLKVLEPIWITKPETAARVRGRIESILDWARARGFRSEENPARWRGHLDHLLPAKTKVRKVKHHAALPYSQVGEFMADLRPRAGIAAQALQLAIL